MAFTLDNLKTGHIIQFRNGDYHIVLKGDNIFNSNPVTLPLEKSSGWTALCGIQKDLHSIINKNFDIIKVYDIDSSKIFYTIPEKFRTMKEILFCETKESLEALLKDKCCKILYEEIPAKELTVSEISELLGYPVKIVREHESED